MGARSDAARAEVLARRRVLAEEVVRLEAAGRAAVDIPAKVRRNPVRTAGLAAGTAFVGLGGPQRLFRRARRLVLGPKADMPKSLLPKEIDKRLRAMGDDGKRVQATLEREFARYLDEHSKERQAADLRGTAVTLAGNLLKPVTSRLGKQLAEQLLEPDRPSFDAAVERIRERREAGRGETPRRQSGRGAAGAGGTSGTSGASSISGASGTSGRESTRRT